MFFFICSLQSANLRQGKMILKQPCDGSWVWEGLFELYRRLSPSFSIFSVLCYLVRFSIRGISQVLILSLFAMIRSNIFYRACMDIPRGTELLVWYNDSYTSFFGIPLQCIAQDENCKCLISYLSLLSLIHVSSLFISYLVFFLAPGRK